MVEVCRHEDRFVALLRGFYRPAYCVGGGGCSPFVWPTFALGFMIVMGSGFAEWCTLWLIVNS